MTRHDRALASLQGLALGDALGMPTQSLPAETIRRDYGVIDRLLPAGPHQQIAAGMPAGRITDDTEQAILLAELLLEHRGEIPARSLAERLLTWEQRMAAAGSLDLLGPSTKAALERLQAGESPEETGRFGTTNGAAMRIAPVGIAFPADPAEAFLDAVRRASSITHNTSIGLAAAAAVGAAVSTGVDGASPEEALRRAIDAAELAEATAPWAAGGRISDRTRWAAAELRRRPGPEDRAAFVIGVIGTSVAAQESVVAALAMAATSTDPWRTLCEAASYGGDTDTVAAIAGAVLGAVHGPGVWPADAVAHVTELNELSLPGIAASLLELRTAPGS